MNNLQFDCPELYILQTENYILHLFSTDISTQFLNSFQRRKLNEVVIDISCQLSKFLINIPIRHRNMIKHNCIFDLEFWIDYYQQTLNKNKLFSCPGCSESVKFSDYGVDYQLLNTVAIIQKFQLSKHIEKFKIGLTFDQNGQHKYFALAKPLEDNKKFYIPGTQAIMGINRIFQKCKYHQYAQEQYELTKSQYLIHEDLAFTIMKMQEYLQSKKEYRFFQRQKDILYQIGTDISNEYLQNTWLNKIGYKSITNEIVFSLQKVGGKGQLTAFLIIYFIHYGIWIDYELYDDNQNIYIPNEQVLYLKDSDENAHYIYMIGGKTGPFQQTNDFSRITVPLNPFEQSRKLKVNSLPALPRNGFNFMGGIFNGKIFVFYGQKRTLEADNKIKAESLNSSWKYENGTWIDLQLKLLPRFDGSSFTSYSTNYNNQNIGKFILFYGGLEKALDTHQNQLQFEQQTKAQLFSFQTENFLGNLMMEYPSFEVQFDNPYPNSSNSLSAPILSVPYQPDVQLLLSGEYLKQQITQKKLVYNFNFAKGLITQNKIFEPPEYTLNPYQQKQQGWETFTPIHDSQGAILYGTYCSIIQFVDRYDQGRTKINLIKINLTNGQIKLLDYEDSRMTQQRANEIIKTLPNTETQKIILN